MNAVAVLVDYGYSVSKNSIRLQGEQKLVHMEKRDGVINVFMNGLLERDELRAIAEWVDGGDA